MPDHHNQRISVIGAGIAGVSTALWLQRKDCDVTLIDRQEPGEGASFGNAGVLASCSVVPVTTPGLATKAPGMLLRKDSPLFLIWSRLPLMAPWIVRYFLHANDRDTRRISAGIAAIVTDSLQQHKDLATGTIAERWIRPSDYVFAYHSRAAFDSDNYVWSLRREAGMIPTILEGREILDLVPELGSDTRILAVMNGHGFVKNPGQYVKDLAETFVQAGGRRITTGFRDFDFSGDSVRAIETESGSIECDAAVIAAGVWSGQLMRKLGLRIPLESERGYHILFRNPSIRLTQPIYVAAGKFVATPMEHGLRCAGVIEFGGIQQKPSRQPFTFIRKQAKKAFPKLSWDEEEEWMGHRPAPCDSLPLIGEIGNTGIYTAFGHHHIGLTGGPKTGRLVAQLVMGSDPLVDPAPYSPNRFRR